MWCKGRGGKDEGGEEGVEGEGGKVDKTCVLGLVGTLKMSAFKEHGI
jgi:hypothetical protein